MATESGVPKPAESAVEAAQADFAKGTYSRVCLAEHRALMDRVLEEGARRIRRSCERAIAMGIVDKEGNLLKKELPADMQPGADRDFGG